MWRSLQRWWLRSADRRGAAMRGAAGWSYAPHRRHSAFGKARLDAPAAAALAWRWTRLALFVAALAGLGWAAWASWRGLQIMGQ